MREFDLCVIGSGPAGQKAAIQAAKLGRRVCVVERGRTLGGVAINSGTIPSKALREAILNLTGGINTSRAAEHHETRTRTFRTLRESFLRVVNLEVTMIEKHFSSNDIESIHGEASFISPNEVEISDDESNTTIRASNFVIATGTRPARPPNLALDGTNAIDSDHLLEMEYLPHSMLVVGGGVIGTEYASMLAALGVKVTLVEGRPRLLDFVDGEITEALQYHLRQAGMTLRLGEQVVRIDVIEPPGDARSMNNQMVQVTLESGKTLRADCMLYCIGRQGATDALNLPAAELEADHRGRIRVNRFYQTSQPHIYACGDVIGFPALASTSMEQGRLAACHMFGRSTESVPELLPYGIYAIPEISMVGWTESQLTEEGIPYESGVAQYKEIARGQLIGDEIGMLKLLIHQDTHAILGVHAIGTGATELIHIGQAVMAFKGTVDYLINTVFNYPTLAECYKVAALNGLNKIRNV